MPRRNGRRGQPQHGKDLKRPRGWHRKQHTSPEVVRWVREQERRAA